MTVLEQLRTLYFNATKTSIGEAFGTAIDLFKQLTTESDREKAAVFMDGIAEMRREWGGQAKGVGPGSTKREPATGNRQPGGIGNREPATGNRPTGRGRAAPKKPRQKP